MTFNLVTFATTFAVIFMAELPDKTMFAALAMGTRMRPPWVWLGTSSAFVVHVLIAVAAGSVLALLPRSLVQVVAAALFAFGAYTLWRGGPGDEEFDRPPALGLRGTYVTAFTVVFVGEWGDLTQLTTANLAATRDAVSVGSGALLALCTVSALALIAGRFIAERVPLKAVKRAGGLVMLTLAVWSLAAAFV